MEQLRVRLVSCDNIDHMSLADHTPWTSRSKLILKSSWCSVRGLTQRFGAVIVLVSVSSLHRLVYFLLCSCMQIFLYQGKPFPPTEGHFKGHVEWSGNVLKNDASIALNNMQFSFNGTYTCQVRNPPDVQGFTGEIRLEVVQSGETKP